MTQKSGKKLNIFIFQKWFYQSLKKIIPRKMKAIGLSLHLQEPQVVSKGKGTAEPRLQAVEIYSHASASASYFISALIRTPSTLFSTTSVSNGIGTTLSIFIVGLGPGLSRPILKNLKS